MLYSKSKSLDKRDVQFIIAICNKHFEKLSEIKDSILVLQNIHAKNVLSSFFNDRLSDYKRDLEPAVKSYAATMYASVDSLFDSILDEDFINNYIIEKGSFSYCHSIDDVKRDVKHNQRKLVEIIEKFNEDHMREVLDKGLKFLLEKLEAIFEAKSFVGLREEEFRNFIISQKTTLFSGSKREITDSLPKKGMLLDVGKRMDEMNEQLVYDLSFDIFNTAKNIYVRAERDMEAENDRFKEEITNISNVKKEK